MTADFRESDYLDAVARLNKLQPVRATRKLHQDIIAQGGQRELARYTEEKIKTYFQIAEVSPDALDRLNVIHVAGTKGKGTTCCLSESILRGRGYKTGFYSSPHIFHVRERIRVNGQPVSKELFTKHFNVLYGRFERGKHLYHDQMPPFFYMMTILAYYIFLQEQVQVAIVEVGLGGRLDSTNFVRNPVVCGITYLELEHTEILGDTLADIAYHKGGILKPGVPGITVPQQPEAMTTLRSIADTVGAPFSVAPDLESLPTDDFINQLFTQFYHMDNLSLALHLTQTWEVIVHQREKYLRDAKYPPHSREKLVDNTIIKAILDTRWLGRKQIVSKQRITYYLDGAHTGKSMEDCIDWFSKVTDMERTSENYKNKKIATVLLYNFPKNRDRALLMSALRNVEFQAVAFTPSVLKATEQPLDSTKALENVSAEIEQVRENEAYWKEHISPGRGVSRSFEGIEEAMCWLSQGHDNQLTSANPEYKLKSDELALLEPDHIQCLICGCLYLISGVLQLQMPELVDV